MSKLLNYITGGQGVGAKFLFIFAVIVSLMIGVYIRVEGKDLIPYAQQAADQLLPLRVENGVVVEPADTFRKVSLNFDGLGDFDLPLVINTTTNTLDTSSLRDGLYLTRTAIYSVQPNQVRMTKLSGSFELPRADYRDTFRSLLTYTAIFSTIFLIGILFVLYFVLTLFYGWCAIAVAKFGRKNLDFDARMRLATVSLICTYIIFFLLKLVDIGNSRLFFFIVVIALEAFFIHRLPEREPKE